MDGRSRDRAFWARTPEQVLASLQTSLEGLSDDAVPAATLPTDSVDPELLERPQRWDVSFTRGFMGTFGGLNSLFDFLTFGALLLILHASVPVFRTGWFVVSVISELLIVFVIRTRRPFYRSAPSRVLGLLVVILGGYALATEVVKRWYYRTIAES